MQNKIWPEPCQAMFEYLAETNPTELIRQIDEEMHTFRLSDLTFAAEALGDIKDTDVVIPRLYKLLQHESSLIREGAVYGLAKHANKEILQRLQDQYIKETSPGVKKAIEDVLEEVSLET